MTDSLLLTLTQARIKKVLELMKQYNADAFLIFNQANYRYLTNFTGEEAQLILTNKGDRYLLSDSRFSGQIQAQASGELTAIMKQTGDVNEISRILKKLAVKRLILEGEFVSASEFSNLKEANPNCQFILVEELIEQVRNVKDELEVKALQKAISISIESFKQILPMIIPGAVEREIAAKLDYLFKLNGGDGPSFETIIASGVRSSWAHGVASDKVIKQGELVVCDFGSFYNGYTADITRTVAVGEVDTELEKIYQIVHEAQRRGIKAAVVGNTGADVDKAARNYIVEQGYGEYFGHGIGHGIGLEIHELCMPALPFKKQKLVNNMAITVEPGIYLPEKGGVRIEDDILINEQAPVTMSFFQKDELIHL